MRTVFAFSLLIIVLMSGLVLVSNAPFHFYDHALKYGVESEYLQMGPVSELYLKTHLVDDDFDVPKNIDDMWEILPFQNLVVPIPTAHPFYEIAPKVKLKVGQVRVGLSFVGRHHGEILRLTPFPFEEFQIDTLGQKLFSLPLFKNYLAEKSSGEIWADLFGKDLHMPYPQGIFTRLSMLNLQYVREVIYNIYLIKMRKAFFPDNMVQIKYYPERGFGNIEMGPSVDDMRLIKREIFFLKNNHKMISFELMSLPEDEHSLIIKRKVLEQLRPKTIHENSAQMSTEFHALTFPEKLSHKGFSYLFSAWSMEQDNREYMRELIYFLEKGKSIEQRLKPLRDLSYILYGTNFSTDTELLRETAEERLKRGKKEEIENQIEKEKKEQEEVPLEAFQSKEERLDYYLENAKESGQDTDQDDSTLPLD